MSTKVEAATLINTVKYQTDRASLKRVRTDLKNLKKQFATNAAAEAKAQIAAVKSVHQAQAKAQKAVAQQAATNTNKARQQQIADAKAASAKSRADEKALKAAERAKLNSAKRNQTADLRFNKSAFDINRLQGLDSQERYKALREAHRITEEYRNQKISLQQANEALRQQKAILSSVARQQRSANKQTAGGKSINRFNNNKMLSLGGLLASPLGSTLSVGAGAYLAYDSARDALAGATTRQQGRKMVATMGLSPEEAIALQQVVRQQTGFSVSYDKIADIAKDTQDKIGQLSLGSWTKTKNGQASFSGGGEMSDWLQIMVNRAGYSQQGALSTLQNVKGPVELAVLLRSLQKSAKLTDSEFTALSETINDFSYVTKSVSYNGQNVIDTLDNLVSTGQILNSSQQKNVDYLNTLGQRSQQVGDSLEDTFAASFGKAMSDAGISTKNLDESFEAAAPLIKGLGEMAGQSTAKLLEWSTALAGWVNRMNTELFGTKQHLSENGAYYTDSPIGYGVEKFQQARDFLTGGSSQIVTMANNQPQASNMFSNATQSIPPINNNLGIQVTVAPSPEFGNIMEAHANETFNTGLDNLTFDMNNSMLRK
ncbi:hypothetical protein NG99_06585 [Erwinia typographi]|uniref:Uncharacterized protein n=1 Tax=Erwinia typographi TaxID=371042 RepID=A0A0A4AAG5_9GAMM|nr:hypothetical protein [Erwinia typographi]KGT94813.1 hypothetical protein NG99_06585 [Erwinia typographi]